MPFTRDPTGSVQMRPQALRGLQPGSSGRRMAPALVGRSGRLSGAAPHMAAALTTCALPSSSMGFAAPLLAGAYPSPLSRCA